MKNFLKQEAAEYLKVSLTTLEKFLKKNFIPSDKDVVDGEKLKNVIEKKSLLNLKNGGGKYEDENNRS